jgi:hypothetical protein
VTCQIAVETAKRGKGRRTNWGWREGVVLDRGCDYKTRAGTTYRLEVEREGDISKRGCNYKKRA